MYFIPTPELRSKNGTSLTPISKSRFSELFHVFYWPIKPPGHSTPDGYLAHKFPTNLKKTALEAMEAGLRICGPAVI